jgi:hypothetical protein
VWRTSTVIDPTQNVSPSPVVDVRLCDVGDPHPCVRRLVEDPVDVPLRIDHERLATVVDEVRAIAERRCLDGDDLHVRTLPRTCRAETAGQGVSARSVACTTSSLNRPMKSSSVTPRSTVATAGVHPDGAVGHVVVTDHQDVRDLLQLRRTHPLAELIGGRGWRRRARPPLRMRSTTGPGVRLVRRRDREDPHLHGVRATAGTPRVVLQQHAEEPLDRAEQRPVDHDRPLAGVVRPT